jgi:SAM-dependent methyltransferase
MASEKDQPASPVHLHRHDGGPEHSHSHDHGHDHDHHHHHHHHHHHGHAHEPHDWHSQDYVDGWIKRDATREDERRPRIRRMVALAALPRDAALTVLDVGAGYGFITEEVLHAFPNARVTLQDFSQLMLDRAREHLAKAAGQLSFALCDLTDAKWTDRVGGPFDLIVSAIAIHNLRDRNAIADCYRGIARLLKPGAVFLDYDLFEQSGGIETNIGWMRDAGMTRVSRAWDDGHAAIIIGHGKRAL